MGHDHHGRPSGPPPFLFPLIGIGVLAILAKRSRCGNAGPPWARGEGEGGPPWMRGEGKGGPPWARGEGKGGPPWMRGMEERLEDWHRRAHEDDSAEA